MHCGRSTKGSSLHIQIPPTLATLALNANRLAQSVSATLPDIVPDQLVVNEYRRDSRLLFHDDVKTTSNPSVPVVSISLVCIAYNMQ